MKKAGLIVLLLFVFVVIIDKLIMPFYISQGSVKVVPDVVNMHYDEAARRLEQAGFEPIKSYHVKYLSQVDSNVVLSQMPEPGVEVKPGRSVYLVVNRREKPAFPMPDLLGRPELDARETAERMEIVLQNVQFTKVNSQEEDGKVLMQSIPAETMVKSGISASITIGRYEKQADGVATVTVPDVLGMSLAQARQVITDAGLPMGKVTTEHSTFLVPNTVISQKPAVNSVVLPGQQVEVTVVTGE